MLDPVLCNWRAVDQQSADAVCWPTSALRTSVAVVHGHSWLIGIADTDIRCQLLIYLEHRLIYRLSALINFTRLMSCPVHHSPMGLFRLSCRYIGLYTMITIKTCLCFVIVCWSYNKIKTSKYYKTSQAFFKNVKTYLHLCFARVILLCPATTVGHYAKLLYVRLSVYPMSLTQTMWLWTAVDALPMFLTLPFNFEPKCMLAGHIACCPLVSHDNYDLFTPTASAVCALLKYDLTLVVFMLQGSLFS